MSTDNVRNGIAFVQGADIAKTAARTYQGKGRTGFPPEKKEARLVTDGCVVGKGIKYGLATGGIADEAVDARKNDLGSDMGMPGHQSGDSVKAHIPIPLRILRARQHMYGKVLEGRMRQQVSNGVLAR